MLKTAWSLFLTGVFLGYGPCLLSCGPLLVSYIAATKENASIGLKTYVIFSLTRMFVYMVFGVLAGLFGELVLHRFYESEWLKYLFLFFGFFLCAVGLLLILEKSRVGEKCSGLVHKYLGKKDVKSIVIFGLIVSFAPCMPLMAVLGFIVLLSDSWWKGVLYTGSFGLGTVISPMIALSLGAGWIHKMLKDRAGVLRAVKVFCGAVLFYLGVTMMFSAQHIQFHNHL